jgi:hypothetical protein
LREKLIEKSVLSSPAIAIHARAAVNQRKLGSMTASMKGYQASHFSPAGSAA